MTGRAIGVLLLSFGLCLPALAQSGATVAEPAYFKWDAGASAGLYMLNTHADEYQEWDFQGMAWNLDGGRYLTTHLKAEASVMWSPRYRRYISSTFIERIDVHPIHVSTALTYQFLENVFAHPYVSIGIRTTVQSEERQRCGCTTTTGFSYRTIARDHSVTTRPYLAAGYKSYFNDRVYVRPELLFTLGSHGVSHWVVRMGLGFDF